MTSNIETVSCCQEYFGFALPAHYGPSVSRNLSFSSVILCISRPVCSVSVRFVILHIIALYISHFFAYSFFLKLLPFVVNKDVYFDSIDLFA